jgi:DNA-binding SARP family transcriptional activator
VFGAAATSSLVRAERLALTAWLDPSAHVPAGWSGLIRNGFVREPLIAAREATRLDVGPPALVRGVLELAAGDVDAAAADLAIAAGDPQLGQIQSIVATILGGVAAVLMGRPDGIDAIDVGAEAADRAGQAWIADRARVAARLLRRTPGQAQPVTIMRARPADDRWGLAIDRLLEAWTQSGGPIGRLEAADEATKLFRGLGAGVLEAWARALSALAQAELETDDAREAALAAESIARTAGVPGARLVAYLALGRADPARANDFEPLLDAAHREVGLIAPPVSEPVRAGDDDGTGATEALEITTFGRFSIAVAGRTVQLHHVRPRARALLRLLALHSGTPVHREVLCDALWPDVDRSTGGRSLHVAISSLRGQLSEQLGPRGSQLIARDGDAYCLVVPDEAVDLRRFERAIADGRVARGRGQRASAAFGVALALHRGELLSEDGPADWAVEWRDRCRTQSVEAAQVIAQEALLDGDLERAVDACRAGLELDRYHDPLWRSLIQARDRAGDPGAAVRDRRDYAAVLADLGVVEGPSVNPS